jgi:protein gp37
VKDTSIECAHDTFNPWRGCQKVSPGCAHCYAETLARRNPAIRGEWGPFGARVIGTDAYKRKPLQWNRDAAKMGVRRRVFCASLADVLEERPELVAPRRRLFDLIGDTPNLDWLLLTKRHEEMPATLVARFGNSPPVNLWAGVSVENQE